MVFTSAAFLVFFPAVCTLMALTNLPVFTAMEQAILADGKNMRDMTLPDMDKYWDRVKREMRQ